MCVWTGLRVNVRVKMADRDGREKISRRRVKVLEGKGWFRAGGGGANECNQGLQNPTHMEPMGSIIFWTRLSSWQSLLHWFLTMEEVALKDVLSIKRSQLRGAPSQLLSANPTFPPYAIQPEGHLATRNHFCWIPGAQIKPRGLKTVVIALMPLGHHSAGQRVLAYATPFSPKRIRFFRTQALFQRPSVCSSA